MDHVAYIAFGSNLGDRQATLNAAVDALRRQPGIDVRRVSRWVETAPVGGPPDQPAYLNGAAEVATTLDPYALLGALQSVEDAFGRRRTVASGPRTLDLDLLVYDDREIDDPPKLVVPHPRMTRRRFVLEPLAELAPALRPPGADATVAELLARLAHET